MQSPDNADNPISTVTANVHADAKKSPEEICRTLRENTMTTLCMDRWHDSGLILVDLPTGFVLPAWHSLFSIPECE